MWWHRCEGRGSESGGEMVWALSSAAFCMWDRDPGRNPWGRIWIPQEHKSSLFWPCCSAPCQGSWTSLGSCLQGSNGWTWPQGPFPSSVIPWICNAEPLGDLLGFSNTRGLCVISHNAIPGARLCQTRGHCAGSSSLLYSTIPSQFTQIRSNKLVIKPVMSWKCAWGSGDCWGHCWGAVSPQPCK